MTTLILTAILAAPPQAPRPPQAPPIDEARIAAIEARLTALEATRGKDARTHACDCIDCQCDPCECGEVVTIYSPTSFRCTQCERAADYLAARKVSYRVVYDDDRDAYPVIVARGQTLTGFNESELSRVLGSAGVQRRTEPAPAAKNVRLSDNLTTTYCSGGTCYTVSSPTYGSSYYSQPITAQRRGLFGGLFRRGVGCSTCR